MKNIALSATQVLVVLLLVCGISLLGALPVMLLWNDLMPKLFEGVKKINFWQAVQLCLLCSILFKSSNSSK